MEKTKLVEVKLPKPRLLLDDVVFLQAVKDRKEGDCLRYYRREKLLEGLQLIEKKKLPAKAPTKAEERKKQRMRESLHQAVDKGDCGAMQHWFYALMSALKAEARDVEVYTLTTAGKELIRAGVVRVSIPKTVAVKCR